MTRETRDDALPDRAEEPLVSVVVPVFCEAANLEQLVERLDAVAATVPRSRWEYIFVNDGSRDDSLAVLCRIAAKNPRCKLVDLSRNFGKEIALTAGAQFASGDAVVCIDADLQHPPELIADMVARWRGGAEVVIAVRRSTERERLVRRIGSRLFNWTMRRLSDVEYRPHSTDFRLMDRAVIAALNRIGERARLFRGLVDWLGFRREFVEFHAPERAAGEVGYSFAKLWILAVNSVTSTSALPLRFVGYLGALIMIGSALSLVWMFSAETLVAPRWHYTPLAKVVVANTLLIGIVLVAMGTMSLYIGKIYSEILHRPLFAVRRLVNFDDQERRRALAQIHDQLPS